VSPCSFAASSLLVAFASHHLNCHASKAIQDGASKVSDHKGRLFAAKGNFEQASKEKKDAEASMAIATQAISDTTEKMRKLTIEFRSERDASRRIDDAVEDINAKLDGESEEKANLQGELRKLRTEAEGFANKIKVTEAAMSKVLLSICAC